MSLCLLPQNLLREDSFVIPQKYSKMNEQLATSWGKILEWRQTRVLKSWKAKLEKEFLWKIQAFKRAGVFGKPGTYTCPGKVTHSEKI